MYHRRETIKLTYCDKTKKRALNSYTARAKEKNIKVIYTSWRAGSAECKGIRQASLELKSTYKSLEKS